MPFSSIGVRCMRCAPLPTVQRGAPLLLVFSRKRQAWFRRFVAPNGGEPFDRSQNVLRGVAAGPLFFFVGNDTQVDAVALSPLSHFTSNKVLCRGCGGEPNVLWYGR